VRTVLAAVTALALLGAGAAELRHIGPEGYRVRHFRATTPETVPHARTIDTAELRQRVARERPVLLDVQSVVVRPETREFGIAWLPSRPRRHLPGSVWLPNVGYPVLDAAMDRYFREGLASATGGDKDRAVVVYCVADCWLSWNAVQRAARYGYTRLYWYREGTDGWEAAGLPLVEGEPVPLTGP